MTDYSIYQTLLKQLESLRCEECHGSGVVDDAAPGDISFNTYVCPVCKGKGMNT